MVLTKGPAGPSRAASNMSDANDKSTAESTWSVDEFNGGDLALFGADRCEATAHSQLAQTRLT